MVYAGFGKRFVALLVDGLLLMPPAWALLLLDAWARPGAIAYQVIMPAMWIAYEVGCHATTGRTVGKRVMGIRVVRPDGTRIGWREAWLRSSVAIGFNVVLMAFHIALLAKAPATLWVDNGPWPVSAMYIDKHQPLAATVIDGLYTAWVWTEVIVVLFNQKKRSLHDYLAGTVVVVEAKGPASDEPTSAMPPSNALPATD